jgi:selenocysteine-specific elongation factor
MPKSQLQAAVEDAEAAVLEEVLDELERSGGIVSDSKGVRLASHRVQLSEEQERLARELEARARRAGFSPPALEQMLTLSADAGDVVAVCVERGAVIEVEGLLFHAETVARAKETIRRHIAQEGSLTVSQFRDLTQSSRKYAIPLLGYLDRAGFTRREGDLRYLAKDDS